MLGGGPQAMSLCIVEGTQQRRWPRAAATRRAHGSCWALPSSVWRRLHGPECGRSLRCSSSTIHTGIAFGEAGRAEPAVVFDRPQEVLERKVAERVGPDESTNFLDRLGRADQLALGGRVDAVVAGTDDRGGGDAQVDLLRPGRAYE